MKNRKWGVIALTLAAMLLLGACSQGQPSAPEVTAPSNADYKVGFIYVGPIGDGGYTYAQDQGRLELEKALGVTTVYKESVAEEMDAVSTAIEEMIDQGCKFIFTTSFGFMDATLEMAKQYPDIKFMHCSGFKTNDNMGTYFGRIEEARYLSGIAAGLKTQNNQIGYVAAMEIPEVVRGINAFTLGVRSVNEDAKVIVKWTHDWVDVSKEKQAAVALLDEGCDIIAQHQDSPAPQQAAQDRGVWGVGYNTDMIPFAKNATITSAVWNWAPILIEQVSAALDGTWKAQELLYGLKDGVVDATPLNAAVAPEGAQAKVDEAKAKILSGELKVFGGPIKDQSGAVKVPEGAVLTDEDTYTEAMNWFVEGVVGTIAQ